MGKWSQYKRGFREEWKIDPLLKDWLHNVSEDVTSAKCRCCGIILPAHYAGLCNHAHSAQHVRNMAADNEGHVTLDLKVYEATSQSDTSTMDVTESVESRPTASTLPKFTTISPTSQCSPSNGSSLKGDQNTMISDRAKRTYVHRYSAKWSTDKLLKDWISPVKDDVYAAWCNWCEIRLPARHKQLKEHASLHSQENTAQGESSSLGVVQGRAPGNCGDEETAENNNSKPHHPSEDLVTADGTSNDSKLRRYFQKYVKRWESDPLLCEWITAVDANPHRAYCRWCSCVMRAHYVDLLQHAKALKHIKNGAHFVSQKSTAAAAARSPVTAAAASSTDNVNASDTKQAQANEIGAHLLSRTKWDKYKQRYRKQWEVNPWFRGWIEPVEGDVYKARCRYCHLLFRAHSKDLKDHAMTSKHSYNVAHGKPYAADQLDTPPAVPRAVMNRRRHFGPKKMSRFGPKLAEPLQVSTASMVEDPDVKCGLLEPDDTLAPQADLIAMATHPCGQSGPTNLTTLVVPSAVNLAEAVSTSLPSNAPDDTQTVCCVRRMLPSGPDGNKATGDRDMPRQEEFRRLARSLTMWEFLNMKTDQCHHHAGSGARLATMLTEFETLVHQLRLFTNSELTPLPPDAHTTSSNILVVTSEDLAQILGVTVGKYFVRECAPCVPKQKQQQKHERSAKLKKRATKNVNIRQGRAELQVTGTEGGMPMETVLPVDCIDYSMVASQTVGVDTMVQEMPMIDFDTTQVLTSNYEGGPVVHINELATDGSSSYMVDPTMVTSDDGVIVCYVTSEAQPGSLAVQVDAGTGEQTMSLDVVDSLFSSSVMTTMGSLVTDGQMLYNTG